MQNEECHGRDPEKVLGTFRDEEKCFQLEGSEQLRREESWMSWHSHWILIHGSNFEKAEMSGGSRGMYCVYSPFLPQVFSALFSTLLMSEKADLHELHLHHLCPWLLVG